MLQEEPVKIITGSLELADGLLLTKNSLFLQVRSSLFELARKTKFDIGRHVLVTFFLLVIINLLVIFIPTMKDIFGVVGTVSCLCTTSTKLLLISNTVIMVLATTNTHSFKFCRGHFCEYADFHSSFITVFENYASGWSKIYSEDLGMHSFLVYAKHFACHSLE